MDKEKIIIGMGEEWTKIVDMDYQWDININIRDCGNSWHVIQFTEYPKWNDNHILLFDAKAVYAIL